MPTQITQHDFDEIRWRGHWIWTPEDAAPPGNAFGGNVEMNRPERHVLFRKTVELSQVPASAPARITADSRYALYVNGMEVFRGPVRSQPRRLHYDLFDLAPFLKPGPNTFAIYVKYYGKPKSFWLPATPNMMLGRTGVMVFEANLGDAGWLTSGPSWKAKLCDAWSNDWDKGDAGIIAGGVPVEVFDARKFPFDWKDAGFDDSAWPQAQPVPAMHIGGYARTQPPTDPYGPLYPRPIAKLDGEAQQPKSATVQLLSGCVDVSIGSPAKRVEAGLVLQAMVESQPAQWPVAINLTAGNSALVIIDMGRIVSGLVQFSLSAPAGTVVDWSYVEEPIKLPVSFLGAHNGTRYVARGENDTHEVFDSNGFRYAYALVHGAAGQLWLNNFWVKESVYPWQAGASFECSDDDLNRIYTAGVRTVQLNSHDAFIDCPTREQRAWVGDAVVHQMVHLATNTDWRLAWHYLTLGNSPRPDGILPMSVVGEIEASGGTTIPDWSLHWVHGVHNLYRFTGDKDSVKSFMPTIERILRWYLPYQTKAGVLKDVVEWNLIDWAAISNEDTSAVITASWARGLREFAELAAWLEERSSQRWAEAVLEKITAGFQIFWDEARGTYVDHVKNGMQQKEVSQLAGALAILAGIAPQERWPRIIDVITNEDTLVVASWTGDPDKPYAMDKMMKQFQGIYEPDWDVEKQVVIAQPFMSYAVHDAVAKAGKSERLPQLHKRWLQFLQDGYDTIGECWGWGTHVHGWSCAPTRDMMFYMLGVTPAEPGYASARIAPRLGSLQWAKGNVPTPHGLIHVSVKGDAVEFESPIPVVLEMPNKPAQHLPAGKHRV